MTDPIKGPSGFDEAQKNPEHWLCRVPGCAIWEKFEYWRDRVYSYLTHPDTEWRRVPAEPMRYEVRGCELWGGKNIIGREDVLLIEITIPDSSPWRRRHVNFILEEVTDAKPEEVPVQISDADQCCHRCGEDPCLTIARPLCMACDDIVAREEKEQSDPPTEMTAEQATAWLQKDARRVVIDRHGDTWQWDEGGFWMNGDNRSSQILSTIYNPYTPLAPVTRGQIARVEGLEALLTRIVKYATEDMAVTERSTRLPRAINEARKLLAKATKEGADGV